MKDLDFTLEDNYEDYFNEIDEIDNILKETGFDKELEEYNSNRALRHIKRGLSHE